MAKGHHKTKIEFSKKILFVAAIINIAVIAFTCVMVWRTCDLTPLTYLIPAVAAEVATGTGFYYSKARVENQIKLQSIYGNKGVDTGCFDETNDL